SHLVQSSSILLLHDRTPATQIYTLSLHDALPIYATPRVGETVSASDWSNASGSEPYFRISARLEALSWLKFPEIVVVPPGIASRSEEHTSELQSRENLVCRLLLEKKKNECLNGHL